MVIPVGVLVDGTLAGVGGLMAVEVALPLDVDVVGMEADSVPTRGSKDLETSWMSQPAEAVVLELYLFCLC